VLALAKKRKRRSKQGEKQQKAPGQGQNTPPRKLLSKLLIGLAVLLSASLVIYYVFFARDAKNMVIPILFILLGIPLQVYNLYNTHGERRVSRRSNTLITAAGIFAIFLGAGVATTDIINKAKYALHVTPESQVFKAGLNHQFVLMVTNNNPFPVYRVKLKAIIESGGLNGERDIVMRPVEYSDEKVIVRTKEGKFVLDRMEIHQSGEKTHSVYIDHLKPNSTQSFETKILAQGCSTDSKLSFEIEDYTRNPNPMFFHEYDPKRSPK
jgi:hypothetical protein